MINRHNIKALSLLLVSAILFAQCLLINSFAAGKSNIALGLEYTVQSEASIENAFPNLVVNDKAFMLTDGIKAKTVSVSDKAWLHVYRGIRTAITMDLKKDYSISGFSMGFLQAKAAGITSPREFSFQISNDGINYYTVYNNDDNSVISTKAERIIIQYDTDTYYRAKYVRLVFNTDVYSFIDEIEIYGTDDSSVKVKAYDTTPEPEYPNAFVSNNLDILDSVSDIVLMYNSEYYRGSVSDIGKNTVDELLPYAAYMKDGKVVDTMFDAFLFLPLNPLGSGQTAESFAYSFSHQQGWEAYLNNTIGADDNINLTALDHTVADIKGSLNLDKDYKVKVFLTMPYVSYSNMSFGKLDGDTMITPNTLENRIKITKWFANKFISAFESSGFKNIDLTGFYWYNEIVNYSSTDHEEALIKAFNGFIHEKSLGTIWIPYYCASGSDKWAELGFDAAALQTGYAFPKDANSETGSPLVGTNHDSMSFAKKYGMGVEIELQLVSDANARYRNYIESSFLQGCMGNGISMFYQGGGPGAFFTASSAGAYREIYDLTYNYIKKSFAITAPYIGDYDTVYIQKDSTKTIGRLPVYDDDTAVNSLKISEKNLPKHGTLTIDADGFFIYVPESSYTGPDSFSFSVTDGSFISKLFTVDIQVVNELLTINESNKILKPDRAVVYTKVKSTGTSDESFAVYEIIIDSNNNHIISVHNTPDTQIPDGCFAVSASGYKAEWLKSNAAVGRSVCYDTVTSSVYIVSENGITPDDSSAQETEGESLIPDNNSGKDSILITVIIIISAIAIIAAVIIVIKYFKRSKRK